MIALQSKILSSFVLTRFVCSIGSRLLLTLGGFILAGVLLPEQLLAQKLVLVEKPYEKGYLQKREKYGFWEYYDEAGTLQLRFNHTTGKLSYLIMDSSEYVIQMNGEWVSRRLMVYPRYLGSSQEWRRNFTKIIKYPEQARTQAKTGTVFVSFEIDSQGFPTHFVVVKDIGGGCGEEVVRSLSKVLGHWSPAYHEDQAYPSRFILPVVFSFDQPAAPEKASLTLPPAKILKEFTVVAHGSRR